MDVTQIGWVNHVNPLNLFYAMYDLILFSVVIESNMTELSPSTNRCRHPQVLEHQISFNFSRTMYYFKESSKCPQYNDFKCSIYAANEEVELIYGPSVINYRVDASLTLKTMQGIR